MKGIKVLCLMFAVISILALSGCGKEVGVDEIKKSGKLVIGTSADYPPYEFHKEINGQDTIVGFDIDIAKEIAKDLGVELEIKDMDFNGLLEALVTGKVDMVIAGMNPTPERAENVDFSKIYYTAEQCILIKGENKDSITSLEDLKNKKIGVQKGTIQESLASEQIEDAQLKSLGKVVDLILQLKHNKVDAIVLEKPVAQAYAEKNSDIIVADVKFELQSEEEGSAVAAPKGSEEFIKAINKTIDKLIEEGKIDQFIVEANNLLEE